MSALLTLSEIKTYLSIPLSDTSYDDFLLGQLNLVSESIEGYCRRKFKKSAYIQTFYRDEYESRKIQDIYMFQYPIVSVTSVVEGGVTLSSNDYRLQKDMALFRKPLGWFGCAEEIVFTYEAGYDILPYAISYVVKSFVKTTYDKKVAGIDVSFGTDIQRLSIPGTISIDYDYTLQNNEQKIAYGSILGPYVNILDQYRSERVLLGDIKEVYVS